MSKRILTFAAAACLALALFAGCDNTGEQQRSVISITSFNCSSPAYADVADSTGALTETWVPVVFHNRPYNGVVLTDPDSPHGEFQITTYRVLWTTPGGTPTLASRTEQTSFSIASGSEAAVAVRLVSLSELITPTISALVAGGTVTMDANITFYGHEVGTDRTTEIKANATVVFANFVDRDPECTL